MNLKKETTMLISNLDKEEKDVAFVGTSDGSITFDEFKKMADFEYDDGYGCEEIRLDLVVVFNDNSWLSRFEYDGSECWQFNKTPIKVNGDVNRLKVGRRVR